LQDISLVVAPGTRLGVIGPNGVGKSTLLTILAGLRAPHGGTVTLAPPTATVGYLAQEHERSADQTVRQLLHQRTGAEAADAALHQAADGLAGDEPGAADAYTEALERWERLGAADLDARIDATAADLGLAGRVLDAATNTLSGGQAARVALAAVLLSRFDITLLDEPTNDLDFDGLERLEQFVLTRSRDGGLVIVSHDRDFLGRTITSVLELDEHDHTGRLYTGGFDAFIEERATARRHAEEAYELNQTQRQELSERAQRERQWATSGTSKEKRNPKDNDKAQRGFRINKTEKLAAKARSTERRIERLEQVDKPWEGWELRFTIEEAPRSGAIVATLDDATVTRGSFTLGPIDVELGWGDRLLLTGPNGSGKTTLVNALVGRLPLTHGRQWMGPSVVVGELGQDRVALSGESTLGNAFGARTGLTVGESRAPFGQVRIGRRARAAPGPLAVTRRADARRAGDAARAGRELSHPRRAHQPSRPARHRATGAGPRLVQRHAAPHHPRPPAALLHRRRPITRPQRQLT